MRRVKDEDIFVIDEEGNGPDGDMRRVKDEDIFVIDEEGNGPDAEAATPEIDEYDTMLDGTHLVADCDEVVRTPHFVPRTQAPGLSRDEHHARAVSNLTVYSIGNKKK